MGKREAGVNPARIDRGRVLLVVAVATVALAVGIPIALASHAFNDVPSSSPHHDDIGAIQYAGVAGGCSPTLYCPGQDVRRDQMATFLRRGYSRTAHGKMSPASAQTLSGSTTTLALLTLQIGGVAGKTQTVKLDGVAAGVISSSLDCPCESEFFITRDGVGPVSDAFPMTNIAAASGGVGGETTAVTAVVSVPTATTQTFRLVGRRTPVGFTGTVVAYGALSAVTGTFGSTGGG